VATPAAATAAPAEAAAPVEAKPATLDEALATMTLEDLENRAIAAALQRFNNNRTRAARALGISVRTLQRKLGAKNPDETTNEAAERAEAPPLVESSTQ
jgi:DNA-binding NtrC family response regulator